MSCKICQKEFIPKSCCGIYCSPECRKIGRAEYKRTWKKKRYCKVCNELITGSGLKYCSKKCARNVFNKTEKGKLSKRNWYKRYAEKYPERILWRKINYRIAHKKSYHNIKNNLTPELIKILMIRDNYQDLIKPNIHRIHNGNYDFEDCCFIGQKEHGILHRRKK